MDQYKLMGKAIDAAQKGDFDEASKLLGKAGAYCPSDDYWRPLVGYGEPSRVALSHAVREVLKEKRKQGINFVLPDGFDLDDPDKEFNKEFTQMLKNKGFLNPTVFLSHCHADKALTRSIADYLKKSKIDVWIDEAEIRIGDSLIEKLRTAIDRVDFVLAIISPASIDSAWVKKELDIAMNNEIEQKSVFVLPVVKDIDRLPGFLKGKFYLDFSTPYRRKKNRDLLVKHVFEHWKGRPQ